VSRVLNTERRSVIGVAVALMSALVVLVGPEAVAAANSQAVEGAVFAGIANLSAPAGCFSPPTSVDWGDGTSSAATCADFNHVNTGSHTYADEGTYNAVANYTSSNGARTAMFTVDVADAARSGSSIAVAATAGTQFAGKVAHLVDANPAPPAGDYTVSINWGDGSNSSGTVSGSDVSGAHTYAAAGTFTVTVSITDAGGASTNVVDTATVGAAGQPAPKAAFTIAAPAGNGAPLVLDGSATHGPGTTPVRTYNWQVAGANTSTDTCGGGTSKLKLYAPHAGAETITLTVTDIAGRTSQVQQRTTVSGLRYTPIHQPPRGIVNSQAVISWCIPGLNDPPVDVSSNGGPPHGCNQTLNVGITQAVGCFTEIDNGKNIPANEAVILDQQPLWTASGAHAIDAGAATVRGARTAKFNPTDVAQLSGPALAYFARPFVSSSTVRFNGVDYIPHGGSSILVVPALGLIISSDATIALGNIPLGNGMVAEDVRWFGAGSRVHIDDYQLSKEADRIGVAGLPFDGQIGLDFVYHAAELTASLTMPNFFSTAGGEPFKASVVLRTDNQTGLQLDQIHLGPVNADVFGLGFSDVRFDYNAQTDDWSAQGKLDLFGSVAIDATPNPPNPPEYGVHFSHGEFKSAGAAANFGDSGIEIFPGIQLNRVGVAVSLNPTLFIGDIGLRALELGQIDGRVIVALPSNDAPYQLTTGDAGPQFAQIAGRTYTGSPTIGVGGSLALQIAGVNVPFGNAYFLYSYPSYVAFGGNFQYGADDFGINGGVNGEFNVAANQFNVEGHVQINLPDPLPGFSGDAVVSSKGIAACGHGTIYAPFPVTVTLGVGYYWGDGVAIWIRNCNIGEFVQQVQTSFARAAGAARSFRLPAGLPSAEVRIDGTGASPAVTITGPGGQTASTAATGLAAHGPYVLVRTTKLNATWIEIDHPRAGTYAITTQPGSAAIASMAVAHGLPAASVSARVTGSGVDRVLRYRVLRRPGQEVTFMEGSHRIATVAGGSGTVHFVPLGGPLGRRTIVAQVTLRGLPNANITVARFTIRRLPRLARVNQLRVRRSGKVLRITWRPVPGAQRYAVDVYGTDGRLHAYSVTAAHRSALVRGIARSTAGRVILTALRARDHGPHSSADFLALARLRTGVHARG
jgi:PKD domain